MSEGKKAKMLEKMMQKSDEESSNEDLKSSDEDVDSDGQDSLLAEDIENRSLNAEDED